MTQLISYQNTFKKISKLNFPTQSPSSSECFKRQNLDVPKEK